MSIESEIISVAFYNLSLLEDVFGDSIPSYEIRKGFFFSGEQMHFNSGVSGIFKPKYFNSVILSLTTTFPKPGSRTKYKDFEDAEGAYSYEFENSATGEYRNQYLIKTFEASAPFIYFKAVAPAVYQCIWPCYIDSIDTNERRIKVVVGMRSKLIGGIADVKYEKPKEIEAKYNVREYKVRGHQAAFSEEVLKAYGKKCAISGLNDTRLLHAAHIIPDKEILGKQTANHGIALNHLHHKAFDTFLLGIDADYKIHVSEKLKSLKGGQLLDPGIISYDKKNIRLPRNPNYHPDRDLLKQKYERYLSHN